MKNKRKHRKINIVLFCLLILMGICAGAFFVYTSDYSHAQEEAVTTMTNSGNTVTEFDAGVAFGDTKAENGFIFYPGGKVEYAAYAPLLHTISEGDVVCVIAKMPYNLAVFNSDAAAKKATVPHLSQHQNKERLQRTLFFKLSACQIQIINYSIICLIVSILLFQKKKL